MSSLWQLYLSVGLMAGLGIASIGMIPASALVSRWFDRRLATAMATVSTGYGAGTLILVPLAQLLIEREGWRAAYMRSEEHTSELQSLMRISYAVFCLKK